MGHPLYIPEVGFTEDLNTGCVCLFPRHSRSLYHDSIHRSDGPRLHPPPPGHWDPAQQLNHTQLQGQPQRQPRRTRVYPDELYSNSYAPPGCMPNPEYDMMHPVCSNSLMGVSSVSAPEGNSSVQRRGTKRKTTNNEGIVPKKRKKKESRLPAANDPDFVSQIYDFCSRHLTDTCLYSNAWGQGQREQTYINASCRSV